MVSSQLCPSSFHNQSYTGSETRDFGSWVVMDGTILNSLCLLTHIGQSIQPSLSNGTSAQVWSTDITYIPLPQGYVYLVAVIDWYSRYVLSWELSNTIDITFCLSALEKALTQNTPKIFNTDQGSQFTSVAFTSRLEEKGIAISQDGRGRALDNIFVERLWRSVKYEEVYPKAYTSVREAMQELEKYFHFYNHERLHQSLDYQTPAIVHFKQP